MLCFSCKSHSLPLCFLWRYGAKWKQNRHRNQHCIKAVLLFPSWSKTWQMSYKNNWTIFFSVLIWILRVCPSLHRLAEFQWSLSQKCIPYLHKGQTFRTKTSKINNCIFFKASHSHSNSNSVQLVLVLKFYRK